MVLDKYINTMIEKDASDLFLRVGAPPRFRIYGEVVVIEDSKIGLEEMLKIVEEIVGPENLKNLERIKSYEGAFWFEEFWRLRISIFYQRNSLALVARKIDLRIKNFEELNLPSEVLKKLCREKRGLILLTGTTGSGKSTTIASMIEYINKNFRKHILSIEEPIEFTFSDKNSIINQREIGKDVYSYPDALKQFALHSPDVIFIGNIRDAVTMSAALEAAETGVLVLSTMHTINAPQTVERIVSFFPPHQHTQVLMQISQLLKGVVSLRLVPRKDGAGLIPAYEVMVLSPSVARLIRENKIWELTRYIEEGEIYGMISFEQSLLSLAKKELISIESAVEFSDRKEEMKMKIQHT